MIVLMKRVLCRMVVLRGGFWKRVFGNDCFVETWSCVETGHALSLRYIMPCFNKNYTPFAKNNISPYTYKKIIIPINTLPAMFH